MNTQPEAELKQWQSGLAAVYGVTNYMKHKLTKLQRCSRSGASLNPVHVASLHRGLHFFFCPSY